MLCWPKRQVSTGIFDIYHTLNPSGSGSYGDFLSNEAMAIPETSPQK